MLTAPRNTAEILCHAQKFHRIYPVTEGKTLFTGAIAALDPNTGTVEPASRKATLLVIGRCEGFTADRRAIIKSGVFKYDNAKGEGEITLHDINRICYVYNDHTVGVWSSDNGFFTEVVAGVVRDIDRDGQVIVEIGNFVRE